MMELIQEMQPSSEEHVLMISNDVPEIADQGLEKHHLRAEVEGVVQVNHVERRKVQQPRQERCIAETKERRQAMDSYLRWIVRMAKRIIGRQDRDSMTQLGETECLMVADNPCPGIVRRKSSRYVSNTHCSPP